MKILNEKPLEMAMRHNIINMKPYIRHSTNKKFNSFVAESEGNA
jgi:hypothetical protein